VKIFQFSLKDERGWLLLWSAGIVLVVSFIISLYPALGETFGEMIRSFVDKTSMIKGFIGLYAPLMVGRSYFDLWLCMEFFSYFGVLVGFYPVIYATGVISGDLERGTLEMLLAQPVSRRRVLVEKFAALLLILLLLCIVGYASLVGATALWVQERASFLEYAYIFLNNYFLLLALAGISFFCATLLNEQRPALGLSIGVILVSFILNKGLSGAGIALWLARLTPFFYADATKILTTGQIHWGDNLVLAAVGTVFFALALIIFQRKDIAD